MVCLKIAKKQLTILNIILRNFVIDRLIFLKI